MKSVSAVRRETRAYRPSDIPLQNPYSAGRKITPAAACRRKRGDPTSSPRADPGASGVFFRLTLARPAARDFSAKCPSSGSRALSEAASCATRFQNRQRMRVLASSQSSRPWSARRCQARALAMSHRRRAPAAAVTGRRAAYSAIRLFISFRTSVTGKGLSGGKRIVPLLVSYALSSSSWAFTGNAPA